MASFLLLPFLLGELELRFRDPARERAVEIDMHLTRHTALEADVQAFGADEPFAAQLDLLYRQIDRLEPKVEGADRADGLHAAEERNREHDRHAPDTAIDRSDARTSSTFGTTFDSDRLCVRADLELRRAADGRVG
jgi:hypothetical protein